MAGLGQMYLASLFIDGVIAFPLFDGLASKTWNECIDFDIQITAIIGGARNDQRRSGLIDKDRVDFVDNRIEQIALRTLVLGKHHVVAQIIKTELIVRAVGHIRSIGLLTCFLVHAGYHDPDAQSKKTIDFPDPFGIAFSEVIVDCHHVNAATNKSVQVGG